MRMDSFPRFTRSTLFKELLVQDLDGKQLPVLDITPIPLVETTPVQDNSDTSKPKGVTRTNSTKVSYEYLNVVINIMCYLYKYTFLVE